ncbi:Gfo/Idh/MocA family protein [Dysgonomonas sp. ZJ709]|uniref:Gfo/Idh/MocA family protein n=1 Tax=Dysgonomonas sp. ZJ709 TaxID=2709797 RepID=UPI0013EE3927|nr:Gfo/Idh/MocA family oxidoreductase [Dysgonomonas sp. ZJ709]
MSKSFKLRFGIVGSNYIVDKVLAGACLDPRFDLVAIYSRTQERADEFAAKHNVPHTFTSLEEMAASPLIDAVYIASPNSLHAPQSIIFMQHGKHVLCEKPFASNVREVKAMIEASEKYNVTLMEAMKPTLTPNFLSVRKHVKDVGVLRRYFSCYCQYSTRYDSLKEGVLMNAFDPALSNGAVMDLGVYTIYPMVVLFGRPSKISATGLMLSTGADGQGAINFEYEGMNATVLYSKIADSALPTEIQGEDGTITLDRVNIISHVTLKSRDGKEDVISRPIEKNEFYYEISEFINLVKSGKRESEINSHENSLITMEIIDEIRKQIGVVYPADKA